MQPRRQNIWLWAIAVSAAAHLILILAISTTTVRKVESTGVRPAALDPHDDHVGSNPAQAVSRSLALDIAQDKALNRRADEHPTDNPHATGRQVQAPTDATSLRKLMTDQQQSSARMTREQKLDTVREKSGTVAQMNSGDVSMMTSSLEIAQGVDRERAVEPKAGVGGPFDAESALLCDIQRVSPTPKTGAAYRWTMVDKEGRSMTYDMPEKEMTSENMTAFNIFESARESPNLHAILGTVLRMADKKLSDKD